MEMLSMEDPLTKAYNRRGVEKLLEVHWKNCVRYQLPMSVIMLDIDRFKEYNDNYGHVEGDVVLRKVTQAMMSLMYRPEDFVGRFGGEEFLVVLPNTPLDGAMEVAERIKEEIDALCIAHAYNDICDHVTFSMGVASTFPTGDMDVVQLIHKADQALYTAKDAGRNQFRSTIL